MISKEVVACKMMDGEDDDSEVNEAFAVADVAISYLVPRVSSGAK